MNEESRRSGWQEPEGLGGSERLVPELPLPAFAYAGRGFGPPDPRTLPDHPLQRLGDPAASFDPERWQESLRYLYACDLFTAGFYWEAHEVWEGLWLALGRRGPAAELLRGLIQLAAAGVQARRGNAGGVTKLARRAEARFRRARAASGGGPIVGLQPAALEDFARRIAAGSWRRAPAPDAPPAPLLTAGRLRPALSKD